MQEPTSPLPFDRKDLEPLTIEELSVQMRASRAFIRLCVEAGCPLRAGKLSAAELLHWLFENYRAVRKLAGLPPLLETEGVSENAECRLIMANALFTVLEFGESRATGEEEKVQLRSTMRTVERSLDQA